MPQIKFGNKKQRERVLAIRDENKVVQRIAQEYIAPMQQRMQATQNQMRETLELLGVPVDGRFVQVNDGGDNPDEAGVWYEDVNSKWDPQTSKWVPRSEAEKEAFLKQFPGDAVPGDAAPAPGAAEPAASDPAA